MSTVLFILEIPTLEDVRLIELLLPHVADLNSSVVRDIHLPTQKYRACLVYLVAFNNAIPLNAHPHLTTAVLSNCPLRTVPFLTRFI